jgi:hypothetical protein
MPRSFSLQREVMPTLDGAEQAEILLPLPMPANAAQNRDHEDYNIIGKLKPGVPYSMRRPKWIPSPRGCATLVVDRDVRAAITDGSQFGRSVTAERTVPRIAGPSA